MWRNPSRQRMAPAADRAGCAGLGADGRLGKPARNGLVTRALERRGGFGTGGRRQNRREDRRLRDRRQDGKPTADDAGGLRNGRVTRGCGGASGTGVPATDGAGRPRNSQVAPRAAGRQAARPCEPGGRHGNGSRGGCDWSGRPRVEGASRGDPWCRWPRPSTWARLVHIMVRGEQKEGYAVMVNASVTLA
jgi:hypothetical protein